MPSLHLWKKFSLFIEWSIFLPQLNALQLDENILKTLIQRNVLPTDPNKKIKLIICYHHHHHVVPTARISLTLSRHFSLSFITSGRSSGLHPISSHSCCMYVWTGRPAFARPYVGVHRSTSLMSSSLLL